MAKYLLIGLAIGAGLYFRGKAAAAPVAPVSKATPSKSKTAAKPTAPRKAPVKPAAVPPRVLTINDVRANNMLMVTGQEAGWLPKYSPGTSKNKYRQGKITK